MAKFDAALAAGAVVAASSASSGLTLVVVGQPILGAGVAVAGVAGGALLALFGREQRIVAPPPRPARPAAVADDEEDATTLPPPPPRERPKAQRVAPPDGRDAPIAGERDNTLPTHFAPTTSAYPVSNLADIYAEVRKPGIAGFLIVIAGPDRSLGTPIPDGSLVTIGRGGHNVLKLTDASASVTQAAVGREGEAVFLRDVKSTNGTYLNNQRVEASALANCDVIAFGNTKILVTIAES